MRAYSLDLRQKIIEAYNNQESSQRQLAKRFKVSLSFVQKLLKRYRQEATIDPKSGGRGFTAKLTQHASLIDQLIEQNNDATLA